MISIRSFSTKRALAVGLGAPLALVLASCSSEPEIGATATGEPIAEIPAPDGASWLDTVTVSEDGGGFILGNPDAPLKLAEYASHTCPACANFAVTGKDPLKAYVETGVVSFEQREVFLNTFDVVIGTLVQCGPPEQMQTLSDEVWRNLQTVMGGLQSDPQAINAAGELELNERFVRIAEVGGLIDFFAARGVSMDQARACLADADKIDAMVKLAGEKSQEAGVTGTPTFTLNGTTLEERSWGQLEPVLQRAGARSE